MTNASQSLAGPASSRPGAPLSGRIAAPGDKSVSHRSLILGALAKGVTEIEGLLEGADVLATASAARAFGATVEHLGEGRWRVTGCGGRFRQADGPVDLGNAGTGVRLMMGAAAGAGGGGAFTGDESLSARPMERVAGPLREMGAQLATSEGKLPATLTSGPLHGMDYAPPMASAQVKSAILLAALGAEGETIVREAKATRDHTETMLAAFGAKLDVVRENGGLTARMTGPQRLTGRAVRVPGDPSSAAFAAVAAAITPGSRVTIENLMTNPTRTGLYQTLEEMGGELSWTPRETGGEPAADLTVSTSALRGIDVPAERAPSMIDEYPVLAVAAAFATGRTRMTGLEELRAKESDRLTGTADFLRANGVEVEELEDGLIVTGCGPDVPAGGGLVETRHDHRLAMSGLVMGLAARQPVRIDEAAMIATSYPEFFDHMRALGARLEVG
jgi:3-phosphoshikimate 1-carboxyvinyltransferase